MEYEIYLDVFWITNFLMDVLVLILVHLFGKKQDSVWRIFCSAGFGATASVILFLYLNDFQWYQLCVHLLINPIMILLGFREKNLKSFGRNLLETYAFMFLLGGVMNWAMETLGQWGYFWIWAMGGFAVGLFILYEIGARREKKLCYEVLLVTNQQKLNLRGFFDTGNLLTDPIMHQPVHIIQEEVLKEILTKERLPIRYIPFHSLGQEQGMLPVVTLKAMYIKEPGKKKHDAPAFIEKPVFGLAKEKLFQQKNYQIILNARCNLA